MKRIYPIWLLVALNIVFLLLRNVILPEETSAAIESWVEMSMLRLGVFGYIGLVAGFVLCGFFFVPLLIPLNILGGALYGAYAGTIIALIGVTLSTAASTVSARYLFTGMRQTLDQRPRLQYFVALADRHVNLAIVMIRFAVVIPYMLQNVALAMTRASIMRITVLTTLSAIPGAAIYSFLGAGLVQAEDARQLLLYVAVPILLMLGLTAVMAWFKARERNEREISEGASASIRHYYDSNTRRFLAFGGGAASGAIHRQLWGPGVATVREAADCINQFLQSEIEQLNLEAEPTLLDLGCGVGGTLLRLASAFPGASLHGVTISEQQVALARAASINAGVEARCTFHLGDFESINLGLKADVIFAVESFTHSRSADAFFSTVARHLRPGGYLIIVDDFLLADESALGERGCRLARDFRAGWQVPSLSTIDACVHCAQASGISVTDDRDLTSLIRLRRPRDRVIAAIAPLVARFGLTSIPFFGNLVGGNALHQGLCDHVLGYWWLRFRYSR